MSPAVGGRVPLVDLAASYERHRTAVDAAIGEILATGRYINGREVAELEAAFAAYCGTAYAVGTGSGTASIHLVLAALGVGPGDEVAVPAHTFIATAEPVTWRGARPRFVDVDRETGCLDPQALGGRTDGLRAIIAVHLYGRPADLAGLSAVAGDVPLIEDAAQAHGAEYVDADGTVTRAGAYGVAGCFSFYPSKNLGAYGDAGAVTMGDDDLAARVRLLRDHGKTDRYEHAVVGYADRLDTIQAAVLNVKLSTLDDDNRRRRALARAYTEKLAGVGDLALPTDQPQRRSVFHLYALRTAHRDALLEHLRARGIDAGNHYPIPLHLQPAYAELGHKRGEFPESEAWADEVLCLPIYPELTEAQHDHVVGAVRAYFDGDRS